MAPRSLSRAPLRIEAMSGHSKWSSIKHKKGAADAKRGKLFTKLARAITVAARDGGGNVDANPTLGLAVQRARDASMPKDNIQRAIDRGTGEGADAAAIERVVYEGYGPGGAAILVEALTDNRNRTGSEVRHAFERHGGSLGEPGSVAWQFENRGVILVDGDRYGEDDLMPAIDAGAEDVAEDGDLLKVTTAASDLAAVRSALESAGVEVAVGGALDGAEEHGRGGGERCPRAAPTHGRPRGARRRGLRPRQLRRARGDPGEGRRGELDSRVRRQARPVQWWFFFLRVSFAQYA